MPSISTCKAIRISISGRRAAVGRYVAALALCLASLADQTACQAQSEKASQELSSIDTQTRWAFRTLSPVTISSPIIRLGDVVQPLDPNMAGWHRLRNSFVALVPLRGDPMTIQRDRLAAAIRKAEATPLHIEWTGPTTIQVNYSPVAPSSNDHSVRQADYTTGVDPLPPMEAERVLRWIDLAIKRQHATIAETYRIEIDRKQPQLVPLKSIGGVTLIEFVDPVQEGRCRVHVVARGVDGPVESDVELQITAHPTVVVPRKNLPRGHRIQTNDLIIMPLPSEEMEPHFVTDPDEAIGLEVRDALRENCPIDHSQLSAPILVHRGDLIEIRSVSGRIVITTNAKAMDSGSESDLIEVETMQPRKRLIARVVQPGLVEIVTRAPRVQ